MLKAFTANPALPKEKRRGRRGCFLYRLRQTHDMEMMYEERRAQTPREVILLYAVREPMLIRERATVTRSVRKTELRGISQPSGTYHMH